MSGEQTLRTLYSSVDNRQAGELVQSITRRLRAEYGIATGEGMVGVAELQESITALRIVDTTRLLDLGSGSAEPSRWIAAQTGCTLLAVDVSSERVARVERSSRVNALCADLNAGLPVRSSAFDACVQYDSIVHVADRTRYLNELRRVMEPGSVLALTSSTNEALSEDERFGLGDVPGTIWRLRTSELLAVLEATGWKVTSVRSRRDAMLDFHAARRDALTAAKAELLKELPQDAFDRLVSRAATVASLLDAGRLDMVFVTAVCTR